MTFVIRNFFRLSGTFIYKVQSFLENSIDSKYGEFKTLLYF